MNSNKRVKVAVGVFAVATTLGLAASGAFTAGGLGKDATYNTDVAGFVGGHIDQSISGANVTSVTYVLDATASLIDTVNITTNAPAGKLMSITFSGGTTNDTFTCLEGAAGVFQCSATGSPSTQTVDTTSLNIQVR